MEEGTECGSTFIVSSKREFVFISFTDGTLSLVREWERESFSLNIFIIESLVFHIHKVQNTIIIICGGGVLAVATVWSGEQSTWLHTLFLGNNDSTIRKIQPNIFLITVLFLLHFLFFLFF